MRPKINIKNLPKGLRKKNLEKKLAEICKRENITFMGIFGSFVKGKQKKTSDIDIAIEFDKGSQKTLFDLIRIENELSQTFKRKVDLGIFSSLHPYLMGKIKKEIQAIYEKR